MDADELRERVEKLVWHHAIDLGNGIVTPGTSGMDTASDRAMPDFAGKTVLDIGAWDGYFSFLAERSGATRVVALDHYAWGVDLVARTHYWNQCRAEGRLPDHTLDETEFWQDDLPGRRGFELAKEVLGSKVEPVVGDYMRIDLSTLGRFDIVLYLGVLYHMREPLASLERVRQVVADGGFAVVETEALWLKGLEEDSLMGFYPGDELSHDYGNWYAPNERALHGLCRAAGFSRVETIEGPPPIGSPTRIKRALTGDPVPDVVHYRLVVYAYA